MQNNNIEIQILGQLIKLYCPDEQQEELLESALLLEGRVAKLKDQSKIIQLEKVLIIIALNLQFELTQEKNKNRETQNTLVSCLKKLDLSLEKLKIPTESSFNIQQKTKNE
ncbi:cell division protein ZapA [Pasteurella atlantica]|uniref:Cell division protein ZapA n=3 Tax=Pasteurellaceae TaxID=712 RepID=A0AAW8CST4_9PAST|nr:cell division protein ZapA [Pasteurella atlantica]MBR0574553.1 cell division protein ZapA [Pasteurella atlantica]MDP8034520.1 cell division protein ZapA [Pasteurella atlantica]MDP8036446.1 cell division protein ZapA [Pasteurella atlantica]MDP8038405.1 cell division protein ZapA [Pasteurella atlantica]MDP8040411.1 cell division protein ZapA [Pasteurella atlantica]